MSFTTKLNLTKQVKRERKTSSKRVKERVSHPYVPSILIIPPDGTLFHENLIASFPHALEEGGYLSKAFHLRKVFIMSLGLVSEGCVYLELPSSQALLHN